MFDKFYFWIHRKLSKPDEQGEYSAGIWQNAVRDRVMALLSASSGKVLEVGCGEGLLLLKLAKLKSSLDVFGIDIWFDILNRAQIKIKQNNVLDIKLGQADAISLPFQDNSFENVICINVLFNLPNELMIKQSLKEISRIVKKNGTIILDIRNRRNPLLYFKYKFAKYYDHTVKDLPLRTYSYTQISKYLGENNFKIIDKTEIGFPHNDFAPIFVIQAQRM